MAARRHRPRQRTRARGRRRAVDRGEIQHPCERPDAAGIAILYATIYSMHARWVLVPLAVAFVGMLVVTAAAVHLATRRDSMFIALLGLLGGFVTAYLLSSAENYPLAVLPTCWR